MGMDEPTIVLPRRWVEALVDPEEQPYMVNGFVFRECVHCLYSPERETDTHEPDCPVRLVQERLQETGQ